MPTRGTFAGCCAVARIGRVTNAAGTAPPRSVMNSRRLIAFPKLEKNTRKLGFNSGHQNRNLRSAIWGFQGLIRAATIPSRPCLSRVNRYLPLILRLAGLEVPIIARCLRPSGLLAILSTVLAISNSNYAWQAKAMSSGSAEIGRASCRERVCVPV